MPPPSRGPDYLFLTHIYVILIFPCYILSFLFFFSSSFQMPFLYSVFQLSCPDGAYSISPGTDLIAKGMEDALSKGINHIFLEPGIHILTKHVTISEEVIFSGAGRGSTFVHGLGFKIKGKNDKRCTFLDFTVHMTKGIVIVMD